MPKIALDISEIEARAIAALESIDGRAADALSKSIDSEVTDDITFAAGDVVTVGTYHNSASSVDLTYNQIALSVHAID